MDQVTVGLVGALVPADPRLQVVDSARSAQVAVVGITQPGTVGVIEELVGAGIAVLAVTRDVRHDIVLAAVRAGAAGCVVVPVPADAVLRTAAGEAVFSPGLAEVVLNAHSGAGAPAAALTDREGEVLRLVVEGLTGRQIAARLVLSPRTVENHVQRVLRKLGQPNRAALVRYAVENGLA